MRRWFVAAALVAATGLAGCSAPEDAPGALTRDDQQQLNDAAAMLDANSVSVNALAGDAPASPQGNNQ